MSHSLSTERLYLDRKRTAMKSRGKTMKRKTTNRKSFKRGDAYRNFAYMSLLLGLFFTVGCSKEGRSRMDGGPVTYTNVPAVHVASYPTYTEYFFPNGRTPVKFEASSPKFVSTHHVYGHTSDGSVLSLEFLLFPIGKVEIMNLKRTCPTCISVQVAF